MGLAGEIFGRLSVSSVRLQAADSRYQLLRNLTFVKGSVHQGGVAAQHVRQFLV